MKQPRPTKRDRLIHLLKCGWVSPKDSWERIGLYALSQRCGELIREGAPIQKRWKEVAGARFMTYRWGK